MNKKGKFILGAGLGLGLGLLLAPKSGKETRKDLMDKCNELLNKVKNMDPDEVKENITEKVTELQNEIRALDKEKAKEIMVIGHKNPDTDSICSAICYADLKRQLKLKIKLLNL